MLANYNIGTCRVGLIDKELDAERERQISGAYDQNIVFGDEQPVFEVEEAQVVEDKHQWT